MQNASSKKLIITEKGRNSSASDLRSVFTLYRVCNLRLKTVVLG